MTVAIPRSFNYPSDALLRDTEKGMRSTGSANGVECNALASADLIAHGIFHETDWRGQP